VCIQQSPGSGNYSMSCRVYAAAAAAAAAYRQHSVVTDVDSGMINYGRPCHDASSTFCARETTGVGLIGPGGGHCGPLYGYPAAAYGVCGADGIGGSLCSPPGFVDVGGTGDVTSRYLPCVGDRELLSERRGDLSLCGIDEFIAPLTQSSSSSSAALVELNDFVCRGDKLMETGGETAAAVCSRLPLSDRQSAQLSRVANSRTTETSTSTRSSCLYSSGNITAVSGGGKSACSQDGSSSSTRINAGVDGGATSFPANPSGTSTCEKAKTSSSGNHRSSQITGL